MFESFFNSYKSSDASQLSSVLADARERARQAAEEAAEAFEELSGRLKDLRAELTVLRTELKVLEQGEPKDICSDAYERWEARHDLLQEQISDVEDEIEDAKSELEDD